MHYKMLSGICFNLDMSKIFSSGNWLKLFLKSQERPSRTKFVYKIQVNPIHTILKYGVYDDFINR